MVNHLLTTDQPCSPQSLELAMIASSSVENRRLHKAAVLMLVVSTAFPLAGCRTTRSEKMAADPMQTASISSAGPSFKKTDALSKQWKADPTNIDVTMAYASSLGQLSQKQGQVDILRTSAAQTRGDAQAQSRLGRAQMAAGDMAGAIETLSRATELNPRDVQALSALGAALDQQTKHPEAREKYKAALTIAPNDMGIVNNMAMSFALQGKLPEAESLLRKAASHPTAKAIPRIRQNLALVIGLQGRFDEAKQVASQDLPPDQVQANMAYLQSMLSKKNTWAQLKEG
jgi:Flp pilus assembly protein TadD